jgi:predicted DNA-binding antitoxin AbrB/MazE fold protein
MTVKAVYRGGVFKPLEKVDVRENQQVTLQILSKQGDSKRDEDQGIWLRQLLDLHERIRSRVGDMPDTTTADIAEDRRR